MIDGVSIKNIVCHPAPDGFFAELVKFGEETFHEIRQTSYSETNPGVIKAFHYHDYWEMWFLVKGKARIVIYDSRSGSKTEGETQVIFVDDQKDKFVVALPPGVLHGYQVLGDGPVGMLYHAERAYDPKKPEIGEVDHNDPKVGFNWLDLSSK